MNPEQTITPKVVADHKGISEEKNFVNLAQSDSHLKENDEQTNASI